MDMETLSLDSNFSEKYIHYIKHRLESQAKANSGITLSELVISCCLPEEIVVKACVEASKISKKFDDIYLGCLVVSRRGTLPEPKVFDAMFGQNTSNQTLSIEKWSKELTKIYSFHSPVR